MQETKTFEETLTPYVEKVLQGLEKGIDYAQEEIPVVLYQYVTYEAVTSWMFVILGIALIYPIHVATKKAYKNDPEWDTPIVFLAYLCYMFPLLFISFNIMTAIQATFFPKLFLVKEFLNYI